MKTKNLNVLWIKSRAFIDFPRDPMMSLKVTCGSALFAFSSFFFDVSYNGPRFPISLGSPSAPFAVSLSSHSSASVDGKTFPRTKVACPSSSFSALEMGCALLANVVDHCAWIFRFYSMRAFARACLGLISNMCITSLKEFFTLRTFQDGMASNNNFTFGHIYAW